MPLDRSKIKKSKGWLIPALRYTWLIIKHKWFVLLAGLKVKCPLWRLITHDLSKFSASELPYYERQFFRKGDQPEKFARCWIHHQNHNRIINRIIHVTASETAEIFIDVPGTGILEAYACKIELKKREETYTSFYGYIHTLCCPLDFEPSDLLHPLLKIKLRAYGDTVENTWIVEMSLEETYIYKIEKVDKHDEEHIYLDFYFENGLFKPWRTINEN